MLKILDGYVIDEAEEEEFLKNVANFNKVCSNIKLKQQTLHLLEIRSNDLCKEMRKVKDCIVNLEEDQGQLEQYLVSKHKKSEIFERKVAKVFDKLGSLTEEEQVKYLMNNERAFDIFTNINFEDEIKKKGGDIGEVINDTTNSY